MLESDWLTNVLRRAVIFRETHYSSVSLRQMVSVISKVLTAYNIKTHKDIDQENKYHTQYDKKDKLFH